MGRDLSLLSALPWNKFTDYTQIAGHKLMAHHGNLSNRLSQCLKKQLWVGSKLRHLFKEKKIMGKEASSCSVLK